MLLGTGTPAPIIMRGMGERNRLITQGFTTGFIVVVARRVRRRKRGRPKKDYSSYYDTYKITAFLIEANGKEITRPIVSKVDKLFETEVSVSVKATPTKLTFKKNESFKVWVSKVKVRRDEDDTD